MGNIVAKFSKQKRFNKYSEMKNLMQRTIRLTIFIVVPNDCQAKTSRKNILEQNESRNAKYKNSLVKADNIVASTN